MDTFIDIHNKYNLYIRVCMDIFSDSQKTPQPPTSSRFLNCSARGIKKIPGIGKVLIKTIGTGKKKQKWVLLMKLSKPLGPKQLSGKQIKNNMFFFFFFSTVFQVFSG